MSRPHFPDWRLLIVAALTLIFCHLPLTHAANDGLEREVYENDSRLDGINGAAPSANETALGEGWPRYSYDLSNSNHNPAEWKISPETAPNLVRAWQTFN